MAKYTASKAERRSKRAQQARLDALTEGGVVSRLEPGQMGSDPQIRLGLKPLKRLP